MQYRPPESLKAVAGELAALLFERSDDRQRMNALLEQLGTDAGLPEKEPEISVAPADGENDKIGIWKLNPNNGEPFYEKNAEMKYEWTIWADLPRIDVKKTKKRILLFGESVARGFFYDPYYTVAMELEAILKKTTDLQNSEVIDLARCGLNMEQLLDLSKTCMPLQPDLVVILAGNNWWINNFMDDDDYRQMIDLLNKDHILEIKSLIEKKFAARITDMLNELKALLVDKGIPVIFVIPAFNLKDWKSDDILAGNNVANWIEAREEAEAVLTKQATERFSSGAARKMIEADPSNPIGFEMLAEYHIIKKEWAEAIRNLEQARDTALYCRANNTPRCFSVIEKTIHTQAGNYGIEVVNIPEIFRSIPEFIADRTLFLDYCHLTEKGIKMAMRHTARSILKSLFQKEVPVEAIEESGLEVDNYIRAVAHFCAATHNGHYGQRAELIAYHSLQAIRYSDQVKSVMQKAIDFSSRRATTSLCKTFEEIVLEKNVQQYERGATFFHPKNGKMMDINLVNANTRALQSIGIDITEKVHELRKKEHGIDSDKLSLLQAFYCRKTYASPIVTINTNFFQVRSMISNFYFVVKDSRTLVFEITHRAPRFTGKVCNVKIAINDKENVIAEFPVGKKWTKHEFIHSQKLSEGVNELFIIWPYSMQAASPYAQQVNGSHAYLEAMFPVLGEIHSFTVHAMGEPARPVQKETAKPGLSTALAE
jgi:hypothetical protein